tara:strand:- start:2721 stop:3401 length:681 start_codon:yes stop_codon:yes gene_type:complete
MELGIDTSTAYASVSLSDAGAVVKHQTWLSKRNHSVELLPAISELVENVGITLEDLEVIFVASGPGSFSSVRVGVTTAKGIASGLHVPIVGIPTADIERHPYLKLGGEVSVFLPAGRGRVYRIDYQENNFNEGQEVELVYFHKDEIVINEGQIVCGESVEELINSGSIDRSLNVMEVAPPTRSMSSMVSIGWRRFKKGSVDDVAALEPIYVQSSQIDSAERARQKN